MDITEPTVVILLFLLNTSLFIGNSFYIHKHLNRRNTYDTGINLIVNSFMFKIALLFSEVLFVKSYLSFSQQAVMLLVATYFVSIILYITTIVSLTNMRVDKCLD